MNIKSTNPYEKLNPFKVKQKFRSQPKSSNKKYPPSSNPQKYKYHRNYKQSPVAGLTNKNPSSKKENQWVLNNQTSEKHREINNRVLFLGHYNDIQKNIYNFQHQQIMMDKFCPSDPYLEIVKDKFTLYNDGNRSQFQDVIRMSNISISKFNSTDRKPILSGTNANSTYESINGSKYKQNPFLRKSLIRGNDIDTSLQHYSSYTNAQQNGLSNSNAYRIYAQMEGPGYGHDGDYQYKNFYEQSRQDTPNYNQYQLSYNLATNIPFNTKQSPPPPSNNGPMIQLLGNLVKHQSSNSTPGEASSENTGRESMKRKSAQLEHSFGEKKGRAMRNQIKGFMSAIVAINTEDRDKVQASGPKEIKFKGITFYKANVQRL